MARPVRIPASPRYRGDRHATGRSTKQTQSAPSKPGRWATVTQVRVERLACVTCGRMTRYVVELVDGPGGALEGPFCPRDGKARIGGRYKLPDGFEEHAKEDRV